MLPGSISFFVATGGEKILISAEWSRASLAPQKCKVCLGLRSLLWQPLGWDAFVLLPEAEAAAWPECCPLRPCHRFG